MLGRIAWFTGKRALQFKPIRRMAMLGAAGAAAAGLGFALAGVGAGLAGLALWRRFGMRREEVRGQVVLITGSSRGLGFAMAQEFARLGARLVICARDAQELATARAALERGGAEVLALQCDVSVGDDVDRMVRQATDRFGRIDILINNAGVIQVGPLAAQTVVDYQEAMDVMFWGMVYPTLAVLPQMLARRSGRIGNITSIGGKVSIPHLLPYCAAKFAAVGFSEGLHAELAKDGVTVTTVCPGLMRTGSHLNAFFKGDHQAEFSLFSMGATLPLLSLDGRRAARRIVNAVRSGRAEIILTPQAKLLATAHGIFPGLTSDVLGAVNRVLPTGNNPDRHTGRESETPVTRSVVGALGRKAAREFNQEAGQPKPSAAAG